MRKARLRQFHPRHMPLQQEVAGFTTMTLSVLVTAAEPTSHRFTVGVAVAPVGGVARPAQENEVIVRLQDMSFGSWRTIEETFTGVWTGPRLDEFIPNQAVIDRIPRLNVGDYRLTAQHVASQAEVGKQFAIEADFGVGSFGVQELVNEGAEMPADFAQPRIALGQPSTQIPSRIPSIEWTPSGWRYRG